MLNPFGLSDDQVAARLDTCRRRLIQLGVVRVPINRVLPKRQLTEVERGDRAAFLKALSDTQDQPASVGAAAVAAAFLRRELEVLDYLLRHPHASLMSIDDLGYPPVPEGPGVVMSPEGPSTSTVIELPRARRAAPLSVMAIAA